MPNTASGWNFAAAICLGMVGLLAGAPASAADPKVSILGIWPMSGPYADVGPALDRGAQVAIEEQGGKVAGHSIEYIVRDSETKAGPSVRRVQEAIDSDKVKAVIGPFSSGVALAITEVAKKNKVMYWFAGGTEDISGARCHRYAFNWAASPWLAMDANLKAFKQANPNAKSLYLFVSDYTFGWSLQKYVEQLAPKYDLKVVGVDRHPLGQREFSSYITKAAAANPDAIYMINFGLDSIAAVRQLHSFGLTPKKPVVLAWANGIEEMMQLDPEMRGNLLIGANYYYTVDTPENKAFVEAYKKKSGGVPPGYGGAAGYALAKMTLRGMQTANSVEPQKAIEALETFKGRDIVGQTVINAANHQTVRPYFVLKTKAKDKMANEHDYAEIIEAAIGEQPKDMNQCKDIGGF
jgi:branched-chain amino acid transport system substrate-binding protein